MSLQSISFKGTFNIQPELSHRQFVKLSSLENKYDAQMQSFYDEEKPEIFLSVDDSFDKKTASYLANKGINFRYVPYGDALDNEAIKKRIVLSGFDKMANRVIADINVDKVDKLFSKDDSYIGYGGKGGIETRYEDFNKYLHTGRKIFASRISIEEDHTGKPVVSFEDGRHRYAVLRDKGFEALPFSLDEKSYETALKHGLIF